MKMISYSHAQETYHKERVLEPTNGLSPILRLDRRLGKCWVELHYGTVFFFGGGGNFDQFSAQPRNSQEYPNSPTMHFDTAATECHV